MRLTKKEYELADNYLEWLRHQNLREFTTITLIKDKNERLEKLEIIETERNAINILIQVLNSISLKGE